MKSILTAFTKPLTAIAKLWYPLRDNAVFFVMMYVLGMTVSISVVPPYAELYDNTWYELFIDLYLVCVVLTLLHKRIWGTDIMRTIFRRCFYIITYTLAIVDVFCFVKFKAGISPSILLLMSETNGNEASEFLTTYVTPDLFITELGWVFLILLVHILISVCGVIIRKRNVLPLWLERTHCAIHDFYSSMPQHFLTDGICTLLLLIILAFGIDGTIENKQLTHRLFSCETIGDVEKDFNKRPHAELYQPVFRLAYSIFSNSLVEKQLDILKNTTANVEIDSCEYNSPEIVFIVGESYNKHRSQLYGYEKENTPWQVKMEKTGRLIKFSDAVSPWNLTSFVFKHFMTTYCVGDNKDWCDYPLFPQLFRKAGYEVTFLTNQFVHHAKDAVFDFSGGFFLNDETLSKEMFDLRNESTHLWDMDLLKDYERLVGYRDSLDNSENIAPHRLTIFHLMGQHVNYRIRCPKSKMRFFPSEYDLPNNTPKEKAHIAYYDNAVWYNDTVLGEIAKRFDNKDAIIIYIPDHGEEVYGPGSLHHCGRNHTTNITYTIASQEYEIPMWVYCTPKYAAKHADIMNAVRKAKDKPFMTDAISHMLLGLAGIKCKYYRPDCDLLNKQYNPERQRLLMHVKDYDELRRNAKK